MKHFYLIKNPEKDGVSQLAEEIRLYIEKRGGICLIQEPAGFGGQNRKKRNRRRSAGISGRNLCKTMPVMKQG